MRIIGGRVGYLCRRVVCYHSVWLCGFGPHLYPALDWVLPNPGEGGG